MPSGIAVRHVCIGEPKTRKSAPRPRRWAAIDRPYGPAPTIAMSVAPLIGPSVHYDVLVRDAVAASTGAPSP